eukprot:TRINITY_DN108924_c0_g1_i1.p1 TRINITY_DN108924_c0_g1~~TRINITY_DN108924_c0_g1_i1.p1  ORF type:complete len:339 (+),score=30.54 TRINITY_DN108924_c0_g1_i1:41-1057(+)
MTSATPLGAAVKRCHKTVLRFGHAHGSIIVTECLLFIPILAMTGVGTAWLGTSAWRSTLFATKRLERHGGITGSRSLQGDGLRFSRVQRLSSEGYDKMSDDWREYRSRLVDMEIREEWPTLPNLSQASPDNIDPMLSHALQVLVSTTAPTLAVERSCEAMRMLAVDEVSRSLAATLGGIDAVLDAMTRHTGSAGVQGHCLGTLAHLAVDNQHRDAIFARQGVQMIQRAMVSHVDSSLVQYKGCGAMANMARDGQGQSEVANHGGILAALYGMAAHRSESVVLSHCIGLLLNLSGAPEHRSQMAALGGAQAVSNAILAYPHIDEIRSPGLGVLGMLAAG